MSTVLKFKCPDCGGEKLIMAQSVVKGYPVTSILQLDGGGDCWVDTGEEVNIDTMNVDCVLNYTCIDCGYLIEVDDSPVDDDNVLGKWIKDNCEQE